VVSDDILPVGNLLKHSGAHKPKELVGKVLVLIQVGNELAQLHVPQ
jgi:hypothetical protein